MSDPKQKKILILCRKPPYGDALSREALDIALAAAVFDQSLALVFTGDGVWQLLGDQDSSLINCKNQGKLLSALPLYDVSELYVDAEALTQRNIAASDLVLETQLLDAPSLAKFIEGFDVILNF